MFYWTTLGKGEKGEFVPLVRWPDMALEGTKNKSSGKKKRKKGKRGSNRKKKASDIIPSSYTEDSLASAAKSGHSIRFIPDKTFLDACRTSSPDSNDPKMTQVMVEYPEGPGLPIFKSRLAKVKRGHRMFSTEKHYLGMGPLSAAEGDEVWVLIWAKVPMVLRPRENGSYRVIGEAYVHGIMHGEAVNEDVPPESLVLE
jgi:hypothetical protein